jgi:hypothetical protein
LRPCASIIDMVQPSGEPASSLSARRLSQSAPVVYTGERAPSRRQPERTRTIAPPIQGRR